MKIKLTSKEKSEASKLTTNIELARRERTQVEINQTLSLTSSDVFAVQAPANELACVIHKYLDIKAGNIPARQLLSSLVLKRLLLTQLRKILST